MTAFTPPSRALISFVARWVKPEPAEATSRLMQEPKKRAAQRIVAALGQHRQYPWRRTMPARLPVLEIK